MSALSTGRCRIGPCPDRGLLPPQTGQSGSLSNLTVWNLQFSRSMDRNVPADLHLPVMSLSASVASSDPTADTTAPIDAGASSDSGIGPMMQRRQGVTPGTTVAISPRNPSIPPWTSGFPISTAHLLASSLPPMESRHSTRTSQSAMMDMVFLSNLHT